jgi:transposase
MIGGGFLDPEARSDLIELTRDGSVAHRLARRANALLLLDDGMSCEAIAEMLYLDDDTIRTWHRLYREEGIEGLAGFGHEGSACLLSGVQQDKRCAARQTDSLDHQDAATDNSRDWCLDRDRMRHHL